jgi:hypothetical protein
MQCQFVLKENIMVEKMIDKNNDGVGGKNFLFSHPFFVQTASSIQKVRITEYFC